MGSDYILFLRAEAVALYRSLRPRERHRLENFFNLLEDRPFLRGETTERDEHGRTVEVALIEKFKEVFWADHAVKEVKILRLERMPKQIR